MCARTRHSGDFSVKETDDEGWVGLSLRESHPYYLDIEASSTLERRQTLLQSRTIQNTIIYVPHIIENLSFR